MKLFNFIEQQSEKIFWARNGNEIPLGAASVVGLIRIFFSIIMLARYANSYQSNLLLTTNLSDFFPLYLIGYVLLLFGFFTPIVCVLLIIAETWTLLYIEVQVNVLIPYLLLFLDSGSKFSIDSFLGKYRPRVWPLDMPKAQIYLLWPYGAICMLSAYWHLHDPMWRSLEAGAVLFSNSVITVTNNYFVELIQRQVLVQWIFKIGILIQLFWELAFVPLLFFKIGQRFVIWYGFFFFLVIHFLFNLSSLGLLEMIYWALVFHCEIALFCWRKNNA